MNQRADSESSQPRRGPSAPSSWSLPAPELAASKFSLARRVATASSPLLASAFVPVPDWCSLSVRHGGDEPIIMIIFCAPKITGADVALPASGPSSCHVPHDVRTVTQMQDVGSRRLQTPTPTVQRILGPSKAPGA
jgi:hypothetical protein